ncbi:SapC family protein [Novosphingobium aerophilum]|uniref:SapC family protein n=1 Tax=Novosphingobium TaxID=165696 RepID=UPI002D76F108|nr:SapC family protein [Novosphingobium sp. RL4]WRT95010.1 SapC family protein [Novosphingobium sp. RL4]
MTEIKQKNRKAVDVAAGVDAAVGGTVAGAVAGGAVAEPQVNGSLPLYREPRPVHSVTHADAAVVVAPTDFGFAATAPMIQLTVDEFERAALDYPILFFGEDRQPYVVTGLEAERNLFVSEGRYQAGAYIPAYLRRYPFVFARDEGSDRLILCLDHASGRVANRGDEDSVVLFEKGEPTELTLQALRFCENYEAAQARTRVLIALLDELDLFEPKRVHYTAPNSTEPSLLVEYVTVNRARFEGLDSEQFLRLREAGALPAIHAQIASQAKWDALAAVARDT